MKTIAIFILIVSVSVPNLMAQSSDCDEVLNMIDLAYDAETQDLDSAIRLTSRLVEISEGCGLYERTRAYVRHASTLDELGRFEEALVYAKQAYELARETEDVSLHIKSSGVLATVYSSTENIDLALRYGEEAIELCSRYQIFDDFASILINQGHRLFANAPDSAIALLTRAEVFALETDRQADLNNARHNLATMYAMIGDIEKAKSTSLKLLNDDLFVSDPVAHFYCTYNLGYMYDDLGDPDSAMYYLNLAYDLSHDRTAYEEASNAAFGKSYAFQLEGKFDSALRYYEMGDMLLDSALNEGRIRQITQLREEFEAELRESEIADLEQENEIASLQRNLFIIIALALLVVAIAIALVYTYRLRTNRLLSQQRIDQLEKEKEVLSLQSMLVAQEEERQRIARDLHDSIGALLSAAKLHITNIVAEVQKLEELDFLKSTEEAIDRANAEVRRVAHDMMPGVLMKLGLTEGIEDFIDRLRKSSKVNVSFTYDELPERLDSKREVMLYRIVQELINNTIKHAEASEIKLMIKVNGETLELDYRDDGKGFNADALNDAENFGLSGLKSRVNFLEGSLELDTDPGQGVHFRFVIPLN